MKNYRKIQNNTYICKNYLKFPTRLKFRADVIIEKGNTKDVFYIHKNRYGSSAVASRSYIFSLLKADRYWYNTYKLSQI